VVHPESSLLVISAHLYSIGFDHNCFRSFQWFNFISSYHLKILNYILSVND